MRCNIHSEGKKTHSFSKFSQNSDNIKVGEHVQGTEVFSEYCQEWLSNFQDENIFATNSDIDVSFKNPNDILVADENNRRTTPNVI